MIHGATALRACLCAFALAGGAACTTIHVHSDHGVTTHNGLGLTRIEVPAETKVLMTDTSGVGVVMGLNRVTVGWMNEQAVAISDTSRCQVVFMATKPADAAAIRQILGAADRGIDHICFISRGETREN